jgi:hypothetical protein
MINLSIRRDWLEIQKARKDQIVDNLSHSHKTGAKVWEENSLRQEIKKMWLHNSNRRNHKNKIRRVTNPQAKEVPLKIRLRKQPMIQFNLRC